MAITTSDNRLLKSLLKSCSTEKSSYKSFDANPWSLPMKRAVVITSISAPNKVLGSYAEGSRQNGFDFIVIGDSRSPVSFELDGCDFYSLSRQRELDFPYVALCPERNYARKNIGYLLAMANGAEVIRETDDDNLPRSGFWEVPERMHTEAVVDSAGWINVYHWFSDALIWPRGLPLNEVRKSLPDYSELLRQPRDCPIQQGLADENPDVDAIYRLLLPLPQNFRMDRRIVISGKARCPFNSQNTTWHRDAFPLLYLPSFCSFRMTDIWRSLIAQRIGSENGWGILFHEPTVSQQRNEHDLMKDFSDEVSGYLHNEQIGRELDQLSLRPGLGFLGENLIACYQRLCQLELIDRREIKLLEAWLASLTS